MNKSCLIVQQVPLPGPLGSGELNYEQVKIETILKIVHIVN